MPAERAPLTEVAVRFSTGDGRSVVLAIDPSSFRVDIRSGDLGDITPAAREAILVGVQRAMALEAAERDAA